MPKSSTTAQRVGIASQFRRDEFTGHMTMPPRILSTDTYIVLARVTDHREIHHLYSAAHRKIDVGVPHFTAPELQGKSLGGLQRADA